MSVGRDFVLAVALCASFGVSNALAQDEPRTPRYAISLRTSELMSASSRTAFGPRSSGIQFSMPASTILPDLSPDNSWTSWDLEYANASGRFGKTSVLGFFAVERFPISRNADYDPGAKPWFGIGIGLSNVNVRLVNPGTGAILASDDKIGASTKVLLGIPVGKRAFLEFSARLYGSALGLGPNQYSLDAGIRF